MPSGPDAATPSPSPSDDASLYRPALRLSGTQAFPATRMPCVLAKISMEYLTREWNICQMPIVEAAIALPHAKEPHMGDTSHDVMTVDELASYLRIPKSTLYKLAQEGKLPGQKVGRCWRFRKESIDRWLGQQSQRDR